MQNVLAVIIITIGSVFLALTVLIIANKAWRETRAWLHRRRRERLEPLVLAYVHGEDASLLAALGGRLELSDRAVVETILLDHAQRVRGISRERLCRALDELGFVDRYLRELESRRWWTRAAAAERLGLAGAERAIPRLVDALADEASEIRMRAAKALGELGGTSSIRPLIRALDDPSRWSTIRISDILTTMGREVVDELIELFPTLTRNGKIAALDILGRIHPLSAIEWIKLRVGDEDADVRARACHALGQIGDPNCSTILIRSLRDREWPVRAMAAKALGRVRNVEAIPALCEAMRDHEWWTRANASEALRAMGNPGVFALTQMLDDDDNYARHQAVLMLEEAGVVDRHAARLSGDGAERAAAERLLQRVVEVGQTARLQELAVQHPDRGVRASLSEMLGLEPPQADEQEDRP